VPGGRSCGECTLCCTLLRVDELRKLGGTPCVHLRGPTGGCGIYATRPGICRVYRCLWLQGKLEEGDRPDRLGAILDHASETGVMHLAVHEAAPGAFERSPRLREVAERYRAVMPVRIASVADATNPDAPFRLLLAHGEERLVEGEWVTTARPGEAPRRERAYR
jgi:Fe-S-cluster containining protein